MLVKVSVPTRNYDGDGIHFQEIYFETDHSPSKEEVLEYLKELDERDSQYVEYNYEWRECIEAIINTRDWPCVGGIKKSESTFVNRKDLLKFQNFVPLWMEIITPKKL